MVAPQQAFFNPLFSNNNPFLLKITGITGLTAGAPTDLGSLAVPAQMVRWKPGRVYVRATAAAATLALCTVGLYTQAAAAGTNIVAPVALTALTAANTIQDLTSITPASSITDLNIFVRMTIASAATGTLDFFVEIIPIP